VKLDFLLLRDAAAREDAETIMQIFTHHFPRLLSRLDRTWLFVTATWQTADQIAVKTPDGIYFCTGGQFDGVSNVYSEDGRHVITYSEDFPCLL
jgi:hypothetical protein